MQGQTMGWVGIYFSKYGRGMKDADSTVGSVVPDKAYVMDLYFKNTYNRNPDKRQDVKIISGSEEDGWTTKKPTTTGKPVTKPCKDNYSYCKTWAASGYCSNSWVGEHCKLSCNTCLD